MRGREPVHGHNDRPGTPGARTQLRNGRELHARQAAGAAAWSEPAADRSGALKRELEIKRFSRARKLELVKGKQ